jgi:hypothetical protein
MSLRLVEYSRMRPQPVQVRLQVWSGSSCKHEGKPGRAQHFVLDDVTGDFDRQREYKRESHTAAWQFGRACFDLAEFATNNTERASLAEQGIAACRQAMARESNSAPAHYYLGMNLGQLAETKGAVRAQARGPDAAEFTRARLWTSILTGPGPIATWGCFTATPRPSAASGAAAGRGSICGAPWSWRPSIPKTG